MTYAEHHRDTGAAVLHEIPGAPRAVPGLIARTRFIDWMSQNDDAPARMVCGGAGYGKTSALLGWLQDRGNSRPALWITLDRGLTERMSFWSLVLHQLSRRDVQIDPELKLALLDPSGASSAFAVLLIRQFEAAGDLTLIIDNADLGANGEVVADVVRLLHHVSTFQIVFTTRSVPGTTRVEQVLGSQVAACPPQMLLFDPEEIMQLAAAGATPLRSDHARDLHALTGGWALAVRAELSAIGSSTTTFGYEPGTATRALGALLLAPYREHRAFPQLRRRSLGPWTSAADMDAPLTALVDRLADMGLGSWEDAPTRQFRLQPVLREILRAEFEAAEPHAAKTEHLALAELHLARDEYTPAFGAALHAEAWPLAARIYIRHLLSITSRPARPLLTSHRLSPEAQRSHPVLAMAAAIDDFANRRRARAVRGLSQLLHRVDRGHLTGRWVSVDDVWTQAVITMSRRLLGQHEAAKASLRRVHRMLERVNDPDGELDRALSMFLAQGALVALLADDLQYADFFLSEAGTTTIPDSSPIDEARLYGIRALVSALRGDVFEATRLLELRSTLPLAESADASYTALPAMIASARVHLERADPITAERVIDYPSGHAPTTDLWPLLIHCTTTVRWHRHGAAQALSLMDDELRVREGRFSQDSIALLPLEILRAQILLVDGQTEAARRVIASSKRRRSRRFDVMRARLDLAGGDLHRAAGRAAVGMRSAQQPRDVQSFAILAAAAALRMGDREHALRHATVAARLARMHGVMLPLASIPRADTEALLETTPELLSTALSLPVFPRASEPTVHLTPRERIVLYAIVDHRTVADVSTHLSVSENTVKSQLRSLYRKLGVRNRTAAVDAARRRGLL